MRFRLAADIGGTFTDVVMLDTHTGQWRTDKVPTTPDNLAGGIVSGFDAITGGDYSQIIDIVHGTTYGLNAVIQRRGAHVGVITTRGFRDITQFGRGNHPEMYNVHYRRPASLVERVDIHEVTERVRADGSIEIAADPDEVRALAAQIAGRYDAIAICLVNSYANPAHERLVAETIATTLGPHLPLTLSSRISAESREFERFSTAILNAYISPAMRTYLTTFAAQLQQRGFTGRLGVMNSNGGIMSIDDASREPVRTLMSGPVGGVIGAAALSAALGVSNAIALDMGGTSFDVSMISGGALDISTDVDIAGIPVMVPTVNTLSVGAGGGSIAWTEAAAMRVGPQSAGAVPGPISYRRGGTVPTVTDANLCLGRIAPDQFLGGNMDLDVEGARSAFASYGAEHNVSAAVAGEGVLEIANNKMADAIREITLWRGEDVADFTLVTYGGAGPLHAAAIADELDVDRVIVSPEPGAFSAWGMLHADVKLDAARVVRTPLAAITSATYDEWIDEVEADLRNRVAHDYAGSPDFTYALEIRHIGQEYAVTIPATRAFDAEAIRAGFNASYQRLYGFTSATAAVEVLSVRVTATVTEQNRPRLHTPAIEVAAAATTLRTIIGGVAHETPVYHRTALTDAPVTGPAVIVELTSTTFVPPSWTLTRDASGSLVLDRAAGARPVSAGAATANRAAQEGIA